MTTGSISGPGHFKVWSGSDGRSRENPYWVNAEAAVDGIWTHSGTGWSVDQHTGTGACVLGWNTPRTITDGDVLDRLGNRLHTQKFNMGMFLGEGREAISMITSSAQRLSDAVSSFQHSDAKGVLRALGHTPVGRALAATSKAMAAGFLAWNFGWKPVLSDMHTGAEALAHLVDAEPRATETQRIAIIRRGSAIMAGGNGGGTIEVGCSIRTAHSLSYEDSIKESLSLRDPLSLAWDLVPLSFLVNGVLPIGNYLDRLHTASVFSGQVAVKTTWTKKRVNISSFQQSLAGVDGVWTGSYQYRSVELVRVVLPGLSFDVPMPTLQVPANLFTASTVVSLLISKFVR